MIFKDDKFALIAKAKGCYLALISKDLKYYYIGSETPQYKRKTYLILLTRATKLIVGGNRR
jgi:hypothetical protein